MKLCYYRLTWSFPSLFQVEKNWKGKKLTIEDPFCLRRSLTKAVNSPANLDFIVDCIKIAYLYFGTVQTKVRRGKREVD